MAYNTLKAAISAVIKTNGNNEITGALLQQSLFAMIDSLGANYQFAGVADPSTDPGTPDQNVFYIASTAGTYVNFNGIVVLENETAIIKYNGTWVKETTGAATSKMVATIDAKCVDSNICVGSKFLTSGPVTGLGNSYFLQNFTIKKGIKYRFIFSFDSGIITTKSFITITNGNTTLFSSNVDVGTTTLTAEIEPQTSDVENCYIRFYNNSSTYPFSVGITIIPESGDVFQRIENTESELKQKANIEKSVNLFDKNSPLIIQNKYIGIGYQDSTGYRISHPIKVENGKTYKYTVGDDLGSNHRAARVDENGNFIVVLEADYTTGDLTGLLTVDFDGYVAINLGSSSIEQTMFCEEQLYPQNYVPYYTKVSSEYDLDSTKLIGLVPEECLPNANNLYGKILAVDGDSICYGAGYVGGYAKIIGERNNMIVQNRGVGGATISAETYYSDQTPRHWVCRDIQNLRADADYIILEGGVNSEGPIGQITSGYTATLDDTTFAGAFESMLKQVIHRFPGKKVGYIFVHKMTSAFSSDGDSNNRYYIAKSCCEKWGVSFCDLNTQCPPFGMLPTDDALRTTYTKDGDGWHPNKAGYELYYCNLIESWMKTL